MNAVAENLKELLNKRGWSEYRLAAESDLSQSTISNIFNRDSIPSIPTLEIICNTLGISLAQFFSRDETAALLTPEEQELLNEWTTLSQSQRKLLLSVIQNFKRD